MCTAHNFEFLTIFDHKEISIYSSRMNSFMPTDERLNEKLVSLFITIQTREKDNKNVIVGFKGEFGG